jgi:hypothetical protein
MTLEEKIAAYKVFGKKIEELEKQKKLLAAEILQSIPKEMNSIDVERYRVRRVSRLSIRTSLESAKLLNAIKMQEVVDKEKIKKLYEQGQEVPDVSEIHYIHVSSLVTEDFALEPIHTLQLLQECDFLKEKR